MTSDGDPGNPYAPDGSTPWWRLKQTPGSRRRFGGEKRLAAWLWFNKDVGETFTMKELREGLGDGEHQEDAEQLNRRLRNLRPDGWTIHSHSDAGDLQPGQYRLIAKGLRVWLGGRAPRDAVSKADRHAVFSRDGYRCTKCGIGSNEPYPEDPDSRAKLTVGHRRPASRGGTKSGAAYLDNLRTECTWCNETVRDTARDPEAYAEVLPDVKSLTKADKRQLLAWIEAGQRLRSDVDRVYDRIRDLSQSEREQMREALSVMVGGQAASS